jgi:hypothetical protein
LEAAVAAALPPPAEAVPQAVAPPWQRAVAVLAKPFACRTVLPARAE